MMIKNQNYSSGNNVIEEYMNKRKNYYGTTCTKIETRFLQGFTGFSSTGSYER